MGICLSTYNFGANLDALDDVDLGPMDDATQPPNAWGILAMQGSVAEWCVDIYERYTKYEVTDPMGPPAGEYRVIRGDGFRDHRKYYRSAERGHRSSSYHDDFIGFRIILKRDNK